MIKNSQQSLPPNLGNAISGYAWQHIDIGFSSAQVFRLEAENENSLYLKIDSRASKFSLRQEKINLEWLENRLLVSEVLLFAEDETNEYLLLSEIPGVNASDDSLKNDIPRTIEQLASGLKMIHKLSIENCPFDQRLNYKIEIAKERMINGLVEEEDFDEERQGRTAEGLFEELLATVPTDEDLVFTHGDYCVPNVILENGNLSGFVDWESAGVADRYQDIALLTRSVWYNFGEDWEESMFEIYDIEPDWKKIDFYKLLDEFF
ncbi:MAG TPA: APH(3') family aminoglycoside O-phosphotransferase [Pyrinomonadaceae bacterium]|nr:APH(3') family aminoglycoside O-phosphotransferase [Pyrinomonadaceae bacterium]